MNWYYYDDNGNRLGPIDDSMLKTLAGTGIIGPASIIENASGARCTAREIKGLEFKGHVPKKDIPPPPPKPVFVEKYGSLARVADNVKALLLLQVFLLAISPFIVGFVAISPNPEITPFVTFIIAVGIFLVNVFMFFALINALGDFGQIMIQMEENSRRQTEYLEAIKDGRK